MRSWFLGKHSLAESWRCRLPSRQTFQDASFGQFRELLKWVCWKRKVGGVGFRPAKLFKKRGKFFATVDHRGTSKQCPNVVLSGTITYQFVGILAQNAAIPITEMLPVQKRKVGGVGFRPAKLCKRVIRHRGIEKYPRTIGEWKLPANGVLSGAELFECLDKCYAGMPNCEVGKPAP
jgi:putative transposase